jgi:acetyltransferase
MHPMQLIERVKHERLARICHCDYDREITLVAEQVDMQTGEERILGAGRLSKMHGLNAARFSVLITDECQGIGLGRELLARLIQVGREEKLSCLESDITEDNTVMQKMCAKLGFHLSQPENGLVKAEIRL